VTQKASIVKHFGEKSRNICAAAEAKHVYLIARLIEAHEEAIAPNDVLIE
jgi:hypothetical protein